MRTICPVKAAFSCVNNNNVATCNFLLLSKVIFNRIDIIKKEIKPDAIEKVKVQMYFSLLLYGHLKKFIANQLE